MNIFLRSDVKTKHWRPAVFLLECILVIALLLPGIAFGAPAPDWGDNGVLIARNVPEYWDAMQIIPDKQGNVFATWFERTNTQTKFYTQKLGSDGTLLWSQPILVMDVKNAMYGMTTAVESGGGLIVAWTDNRNKRKPDVFAQKIDGNGNKLWGDTGKPVYVGAGMQDIRAVVSDDVGGAIVVWRDDERPGFYMQRVDGNCNPQWQADGVSINDFCGIRVDDDQPYYGGDSMGDWINIQSDGSGGLYLNWSDIKPNYMMEPMPMGPNQAKQDGHSFLLRVDRNCQKAWPVVTVDIKGVPADMMMGNQLMVTGDNSAIIAWSQPNGNPYIVEMKDNGYSAYSNPDANLFAVKVTPDGKLAWDASKPLITMSGEANPQMYFMGTPNVTKEGLLYSLPTTKMEKRDVQEPGSDGKMHTVKMDIPVVVSTEFVNIDGTGKTTWKKTVQGGNSYPGIFPDLKTGDFFLMMTKYLEDNPMPMYPGQGLYQIRMQRFDSSGTALWQEGGANVTGITGMMGVIPVPDGVGGFYTTWRKQVDSASAPGLPIKAYYGPTAPEQMPKTDIYVQHFLDDGKLANTWSDMSAQDWSLEYVEGLASVKAIGGYADGSFKPAEDVTRAEFAKMVVVALGIFDDTSTAAASLKGTDAERHWSAQYIAKAVGAGLLKGYPGGGFKPDTEITRAEASTIISRAKNLQADASSQGFSDVSAEHWACASIGAMKKLGIVNGYGDGTFRPSGKTTRSEAAKMIYNALKL
ncbi:MAG: S-layer homology domain-containing protein [Candidatus Aquicultor sp.]